MLREFEKRLISSVILILVTFLLILEGKIFFNIFLFIAFLISSYEWLKMIKKVKSLIAEQLKDLPRKKIASESLNKNGILIYVSGDKEIISIINYIAPEHIEILTKNYKKFLNNKIFAGSICLGPYSSMALSDYGPTQHSLPTAGSAKFSSGLSVKDFLIQTSYNELSKKGVAKLGKSGYLMSNFENLLGHSRSIKKRMEKK